ncbi:hypothetical protein B0H13DRAFT_1867236 [Mycena leptocephala]|nr:hypothetical protein B0H13DRAFT_1867236 [Mycena leptocephala]
MSHMCESTLCLPSVLSQCALEETESIKKLHTEAPRLKPERKASADSKKKQCRRSSARLACPVLKKLARTIEKSDTKDNVGGSHGVLHPICMCSCNSEDGTSAPACIAKIYWKQKKKLTESAKKESQQNVEEICSNQCTFGLKPLRILARNAGGGSNVHAAVGKKEIVR